MKNTDAKTKRHGGARPGAGRPRKHEFADMLRIGGTCEARWREACAEAAQARLEARSHAAEIRALHEAAHHIPVAQRAAWLASEAYEDHATDIRARLHEAAGHTLSGGVEIEGQQYGADYAGSAPRVIAVPRKPRRGARALIVAAVAKQFDMPESVVDHLWQQFRLFEREAAKPQDSAKT